MAAASSSTTNTSDGSGKPSLCPRGHWRPGEDEKLRQLVEKYGPQNWNSIAEKLEGRSGGSSCWSSLWSSICFQDVFPFFEDDVDPYTTDLRLLLLLMLICVQN
jgi:hypothetical protein